jgi:hypothetical protein
VFAREQACKVLEEIGTKKSLAKLKAYAQLETFAPARDAALEAYKMISERGK